MIPAASSSLPDENIALALVERGWMRPEESEALKG